MEAIVKFIDLKNSGIVKDKQLIQQECLRRIGEALHEDGGLSMFHATWFITVYRDYLTGFRMFRTGEVESIYAHPLMKQAVFLIVHRKILRRKKELYSEMIKRSIELLKPVKQCAKSTDQTMIRMAGYAEICERKLESIENEMS
ncbi:MAG: hypothetical protein GY866_03255 [Proteobacteria bacterium]|nr:hypothetical protein [Pseudomonadota bacterium]